jgi:hypothetical protein
VSKRLDTNRTAVVTDPHAPDFIVLVHQDADEYGYGHFGDSGYGRELMAWIRGTYRRLYRIGAEPLVDTRFGILILARGDPAPP